MRQAIPYRGMEIYIDDLERPFFEAAAQERLVIQVCRTCGIYRYPPAYLCAACGSGDAEWQQVEGKGRVHACLIAEHAVREDFPAPYAIGLIELEDLAGKNHPGREVRLLSAILAADGSVLRDVVDDGTPVIVEFVDLAPGLAFAQFKLADASTARATELKRGEPA